MMFSKKIIAIVLASVAILNNQVGTYAMDKEDQVKNMEEENSGESRKRNREEAFSKEKNEEATEVEDQFNLGICYFKGQGVSKDINKAIELLQKSADQKYSIAKFKLGLCYQKGLGVVKNPAKAIELFKEAGKLKGVNSFQEILIRGMNEENRQQCVSEVILPILEESTDSTEGVCDICIENINDFYKFRCGHKFCKGCVKELLKRGVLICPICRRDII